MAVRESVRIDLGKVDRLIEEQEAELEPKHLASIEYRETARRHVAGGVASSWQASPPHAIFIDRGDGSHIWDIDGNEYVDYHLGYGAMVVGHAHPAVVEAIRRQASRGTHFAQPTKHLDVIGENLAERFSLPLWRFCNSGTEATLEAARLMRAKTGRDLLIKIEGTYHGHHDSLMFSVIPDPDLMGPRDHPVTVPQAPGIPQAFADLVRVVPFNDLAAARQAFEEHRDEVAGMIVEPAMMNCGVILPEPGYLQGLADLCHEFGAYLAFDEVKTGATLAYGGAVEAFGVVPDIVCLAKAIGGGTPCGAIGATEELFRLVVDGEYDMAGTFNGNPLTMAATRATLTEVLTRDAYGTLDHLDGLPEGGAVRGDRALPAPGVRHRRRREGVRDLLDPRRCASTATRSASTSGSRTSRGCSSRTAACSSRRGPSRRPGRCRSATRDEDAQRYVDNFEAFARAITS